LKIGIVAPYDLSQPGGVNVQIRQQARVLRERGHQVLVCGPASQRERLYEGERGVGGAIALNIGGTVSAMGLNPGRLREVRRLLATERFDVLHVHEPLTPVLPWLFVLSARCPLVATFHVYRERPHPFYRVFWPLLRLLIRRVDHRIAVSRAALSTVQPFFPGEYALLPNGIDVARFAAPAPRPAVFDGKPSVLFLGRLEERKGLPHLIRAMPTVQTAAPGTALIVAGDGPDRADCEALAGALGVEATFVGPVADADKAAYFQAADVYCSPATGGESFGVVLLEAMAAGTPVVASAIDGYAGVLGPAGAGLLTPPTDAEALGNAIVRVLREDGLKEQLGAGARGAALQYDWSVLAGRLEDIYARVIAGRR
jgi:phosphatidylinositol alpha-mannosyltransferase